MKRNLAGRGIELWVVALRLKLAGAMTTLRLVKTSWGAMATFLFLALANALTDGFSVLLIVPLLESFSADSIFAGVPLLSEVARLLQPLDPTARLQWVAVLILLIITSKAITQYLVEYVIYSLPLRIERDLRVKAFDYVMNSSIAFAETLTSGEIGNFTASFPSRVGLAARFLLQIVSSLLTVGLMLGLLLSITPAALIGLLAFAVIASLVFRAITARLSKRIDAELTDAQQRFTQVYFEAVNNKKTIRVFNATKAFQARIAKTLERLRRAQNRNVAIQNATYPFFSLLSGAAVCISVIGLSLYEPGAAKQLLAVLLVFLAAATRIIGPLSVLHIAVMHYSIHVEAATRLSDFFDRAATNREPDGTIVLHEFSQPLRFDGVTFQFEDRGRGIRDVDFTIAPGEFVAIVGPSGAGKSTVLNLILRLYRPTNGRICLGDTDLNDLTAQSWRGQLSVVSQDVPIFNGTVRENIQFGDPAGADDERIWRSLQLAAIDGFVRSQWSGLDTMLGEGGANLSGGERQRLGLARAFYHERSLIVLDEATSQLDIHSELSIEQSVKRLHKMGRTIVAVAHRWVTIRGAGRLVVLNEGAVVAMGSPSELRQTDPFVGAMSDS